MQSLRKNGANQDIDADLLRAADLVCKFDSSSYVLHFLKNIFHRHQAENGLGYVTRYIEESHLFLILGLGKLARERGSFSGDDDSSPWAQHLIKANNNSAAKKRTATLTDFLCEFTPHYQQKLRSHMPNLGRFHIDMHLNNLFFHALHFEARHAGQLKNSVFSVTPKSARQLTETYYGFIRAMFPHAHSAKAMPHYPETVADMLSYLGRFENEGAIYVFYNYQGEGGAQTSQNRFNVVKKAKSALINARIQENGGIGWLSGSAYTDLPREVVTPEHLIEGLHHFLGHNHEKLPATLRAVLLNMLTMSLQQYGVWNIEDQHHRLREADRKISGTPHHAARVLQFRGDQEFFDTDLALQPSRVKMPAPQSLISAFREQIAAQIQEAQDSGKTNGKLTKIRERLARFEEALQITPDLELVVVPYTRRIKDEKLHLRDTFNVEARHDFIRNAALKHPWSLFRHGVSIREIFFMARTGRVADRLKGKMTVEHIHDLAGGGFNEATGFCLMPAEMNNGKNNLILPQTQDMKPGETRLIVSYAPKKIGVGKSAKYPLIIGDFS
jgi:hypothetical protein